MIPATFGYTIVAATLSIPGFILGESALSLLGLGIQEPDASWGNLLADAQNVQSIAQFPWILSPGRVHLPDDHVVQLSRRLSA